MAAGDPREHRPGPLARRIVLPLDPWIRVTAAGQAVLLERSDSLDEPLEIKPWVARELARKITLAAEQAETIARLGQDAAVGTRVHDITLTKEA